MSTELKELLFTNAVENVQNGNYEIAKSQYEECLKNEYNIPSCLINLAFLLKKMGSPSDDPKIKELFRLYQEYMDSGKFLFEKI